MSSGESQPSTIRILHIEDSVNDRFVIERHFRKNDFSVDITGIDSREELLECLADSSEEKWDVVLCDHKLPKFSSREALELIKESGNDLPFLVVSGAIGETGVLEILKAGAHDYIAKDNLLLLIPAIRREICEAQVRKEKAVADENLRVTNERLREAVEKLSATQAHLGRIEKLRALGQIASGVAHDFNNSLSKILGITEILKSRCPEQTDLVKDLREVTRDSSKVVQRLRNFYLSRPVSDDLKPVNLPDLLQRTIELTRPKWHSVRNSSFTRIQCRYLPSDVPAVAADESELREVITNLIFNAVDAMPEVDSGVIEISATESEGYVEIAIEDNGCGMPKDVLQRCREPFYTTKGDNGTGLGLGLAVTVLTRFGGSLSIDSTENVGTTVRLRLPVYHIEEGIVEVEGPASESPREAGRPGLRVLLVEDDPLLLNLMTKLLELEGHDVVAACMDAESALEKVEDCQCEIAIIDFNLPGIDGTEFSRRIKEIHPEIPVVLSTGHFEVDDDSWPETVDRILPKPVSRESLRMVVSEAVALPA